MEHATEKYLHQPSPDVWLNLASGPLFGPAAVEERVGRCTRQPRSSTSWRTDTTLAVRTPWTAAF
jgi:hypothetical protein